MRRLTLLITICVMCLTCAACGDKDLKAARAAVNDYYAAFTTGDVDRMADLTSERYRRDFQESNIYKNEAFLQGFKLSGQKCKYEILDVQKLNENVAEARLKVFTPEVAAVQKALQEAVTQEKLMDMRMNGYTQPQIEEFILESIYATMTKTDFPLVENETVETLIKEDGGWKIDRNITSMLK